MTDDNSYQPSAIRYQQFGFRVADFQFGIESPLHTCKIKIRNCKFEIPLLTADY